MSNAEKRIAEIAGRTRIGKIETDANMRISNISDYGERCIRAALSDPIIRREIENSALERAAGVCDNYMCAPVLNDTLYALSSAIRALKG